MSNFVLSRVGLCKIGAVGALEAACVDMGSIAELSLAVSQDVLEATASNMNDAVVETGYSAAKASLKVTGIEEFTAANVARALGATVSGTDVIFDGGGGAPTYFSGYFHGFKLDGSPALLHVVKACVKPGTELKLSKDQGRLDMELVLLADPTSSYGYKMYAIKADTADTTAPTLASTVPANAATGVAVGSTFAWTFSEAIRLEDMTSKRFYVFKDSDGSIVAGALALSGDAKTVTFTPTAALTAAAAYRAVCTLGLRDVAGNALVGTDVRKFTCA